MADQLTWIPIYEELADKLLDWESRQRELIVFLEEMKRNGNIITSLQDKNKEG